MFRKKGTKVLYSMNNTGGAATLREEASRRPGEGPPLGVRPEAAPEAATRAAGADGKAIV